MGNSQTNIQTVLPYACMLGEGPVWDAEHKRILWLDITEGDIHQYTLAQDAHKVFNVGEMIGSIALREGGGLVGGLEHGFAFIDPENEKVDHIADPEQGLSNRFNDGKCDAAGRFWAGTMAISEEENKGNLYVLEADLSVKKKIENVSISNGIAWSADSSVMYYINTPTNYVFAFDYNIEDATIDNQRVVLDLTHENGYADGMTIDEEGMLWVAYYGGWRVARYDPNNGKLLRQIELPVANVTSCTFGGVDLTDLYITTAMKGLSEEELSSQPLAGCLFVVKDCGYKGTATQKFKG
ncbi:MAG TPA: SMP-30/gluconolactonase/LRE family protein [Parafilimonas sp.]|nr:SMP-30/gluconolactonase/LRE family protein [Parafilimonas sp.]